jgi:hypothetical protein
VKIDLYKRNKTAFYQPSVWVDSVIQNGGSLMKKVLLYSALIIALLGLVACVSSVSAQNISMNPTYGTYNVNNGFSPDPTSYTVVAGGTNDAVSLGSNCRGNVADAPDVRVHYTAGSFPLRFYVSGGGDTTLVVNTPNGQWSCNDDFGGSLSPAIDFSSPQSGQYDIWVGTYTSGEYPSVELMMTELPASHGPGGGGGTAPAATGGGIDFSGNPTYGTYNISSGFAPDPTSYTVVAGGSNPASQLGSSCSGNIANAPDVRVHYTSGSFPLRFYVQGGGDTTLAINAPNGQWYCNDDFNGSLSAAIDFSSPMSGQYDIFIGTYSSGDYPSANLMVTELPGSNGPN